MNKETFFKRKTGSARNNVRKPDFSLDKPVIDAVD
jgi:hypothetical protein